MYETATKSYQEANCLSADPLKLVRMCYEGAVRNLKMARDAYIDRDYETKANALVKTLDIIHELNSALDMEKGGDIARNLRALYMYMTQALTEGDLKRDLKAFDDVIRMLEELESAWQELFVATPGSINASTTAVPYGTKKTAMISGSAWSA